MNFKSVVKTKRNLYAMPGLGASPEIFEFLKFDENINLICLSWIIPKNNECISDYALRMSKKIIHKNACIMGVSFGGILVQEMSRFIKFEKIIIVSSVKSNKEFPMSMVLAKKTKVYKFFPVQWIKNVESLASFSFGKNINKRLDLYKKYLSVRNPVYLNWAINELINWDQDSYLSNIIHIHGEKDNVFPIKYLKNIEIIKDANHAMILTKSNWFIKNIPLILDDKYIFNLSNEL